MFSIVLLFEIFYSSCSSDVTNNYLQNWGDYTGMSQAVLVYLTYASDVLLICWFGTQLIQQVRKDGLFLMLLTL
jgi:hypothetical protein